MFIKIKDLKEIKDKISNIEGAIESLSESRSYYQRQIKELSSQNKLLEEELEHEKKSSRIYKSKAGGYSTSAKKSQLKIEELENNIEKILIGSAEEQSKLQQEIADKEKTIKVLNKDNKNLQKQIEKLKEEKKQTNKIVKDLNKDILRLKAKPKETPTIQELEKDKLFHGRRNKR